MNFTLYQVNIVLNHIGLELKTLRTDGVYTIKRINDNKVVAAIHPITRRFWVRKRNKNGINGNFEKKKQPMISFNDLKIWSQEALNY